MLLFCFRGSSEKWPINIPVVIVDILQYRDDDDDDDDDGGGGDDNLGGKYCR